MDIIEFLNDHFGNTYINGDNVQLQCPFHDDKGRGHLYININTGLWCCFSASCGEKGNLERFLIKTKKSGYIKNVDVSYVSNKRVLENTSNTCLDESVLASFSNKIPTNLLDSGFSPKILINKGIKFDEKNYRTIFPIRDKFGVLVGVSGRAVFDESPKYKFYRSEFREVYPEYEFKKSHYLYNYDEVYKRIASTNTKAPIIIVEGFKACIWMIQHGYINTVAIMGTSLSLIQEKLVTELFNRFIIFLDNDEGGTRNVYSIGERLSEHGVVWVMKGDRKQPDEYTSEELKKLYNNRTKLEQFLLQNRR